MARFTSLSVSAVVLLVVLVIQLPSSAWAWWSRESATMRPPSPISSSCYSPSGADCSWYRDCLEKKIPCSGHSDDYAIAYADKYCRRYQANRSRFSSQGQQWIDGVRKCLQVALAPILRTNPSCSEVKEKGFDSHVDCYVSPAGAPSYCDLSDDDKDEVENTIRDAVFSELFSTIGGFFQVQARCLFHG